MISALLLLFHLFLILLFIYFPVFHLAALAYSYTFTPSSVVNFCTSSTTNSKNSISSSSSSIPFTEVKGS